jgi:hypothetical protein
MEDRALRSSLEHIMQMHHKFIDEEISSCLPPGEASLLRLLHWQVHTGRVCHDVHDAMKWSMLRSFSDQEVLKSAYITVESLRNAYSQLALNFATWLPTVLEFVDWNFLHIQDMWISLGWRENC